MTEVRKEDSKWKNYLRDLGSYALWAVGIFMFNNKFVPFQ